MPADPTFQTPHACLILVILALSPCTSQAAGFAIKNQSSLALGNAFAGATAGAENVSYMFFNPAGLTRHEGYHLDLDASFVAPKATFKNGAGSTVLGSSIGGRKNQGDVAENALVPSIYAMFPIGNAWRAGIGVNAPFGQTTDYDADWVGRYHALRSELSTININPALAFRVNSFLSIGAGAQIQYIEAELTNAIDFGTIGAAAGLPGAVPSAQDGKASVRGDDWSFGYNLGI